ncbi:hypothetical protein L1987_38653 [Smallanthus sonchifolius]|uniref:Uncharacterized protein n=1 Tax=Smallanthus sonchifolius TaxID=185202 RepID=A0ACB9HK46_9ASTR|nr:hypothetical protein L1987_38653 [Smallanthus sonchifolius]
MYQSLEGVHILDQWVGKLKKENEMPKAEETIQFRKMKYTLLEESHAQEKEFYRLKAEKMEYDKEKEQSKIRQEDERLRLEVEKMELAKKESDHRIMMMDVSAMPEMQRLYFEELYDETQSCLRQSTLKIED